jgi:hypothetical protein
MSSRRDVLLGTLGIVAAASLKAGTAAQTSPPPAARSSILSTSAPIDVAGRRKDRIVALTTGLDE